MTVDSGPTLDTEFVVRWIRVLDELVAEAKDLLTELDAAIGDADHGTNMTRGLHAAHGALADRPPAGPAAACRDVGLALIRSIGGASGPLYGTVFVALGRAMPDDHAVTPSDLVSGLRESLRGVQKLGAAVVGDKTMVDAIAPGVAELERGFAEGLPLPETLKLAVAAAEAGAVATIPMRARKGRASYLGARSEGHQDPGATSATLLFRALLGAVEHRR